MLKAVLLSILILLGIALIFLGIRADMLPPSITGAGFVVIAIIFYTQLPNREGLRRRNSDEHTTPR
ncbi:MAG: hypothetical protein Q4F57_10235 [Weeksellaceae bacterium]|nr:hypothetical protein [Weeksellaceae bacterium]